MVLVFLMMHPESSKPKGEEAVRSALLEAALAAYSGDGTFSVRRVAERAGVNHGQVHHYFGGMDGLKQQMLTHLGASLEQQILARKPTDLQSMLALAVEMALADKRFVRVLARRLIETSGDDAPLQVDFPVVQRLKENTPDGAAPAMNRVLADGMARVFGWALYGEWITQALGLDAQAIEEMERALPQLVADGLRGRVPAASAKE